MELALCTHNSHTVGSTTTSSTASRAQSRKKKTPWRVVLPRRKSERERVCVCVHYFTIFVFRLSDCLDIACSFIRFISVRKAFRNKSRTIFFMLIICSYTLYVCALCRIAVAFFCYYIVLFCSVRYFFSLLFLLLFGFEHSSLVYFVFLCRMSVVVLFSAERWFGETPILTRIIHGCERRKMFLQNTKGNCREMEAAATRIIIIAHRRAVDARCLCVCVHSAQSKEKLFRIIFFSYFFYFFDSSFGSTAIHFYGKYTHTSVVAFAFCVCLTARTNRLCLGHNKIDSSFSIVRTTCNLMTYCVLHLFTCIHTKVCVCTTLLECWVERDWERAHGEGSPSAHHVRIYSIHRRKSWLLDCTKEIKFRWRNKSIGVRFVRPMTATDRKAETGVTKQQIN